MWRTKDESRGPVRSRRSRKQSLALVLPDAHADEDTSKFIRILENLRALAAIAKAARERANRGGTDSPGPAGRNVPGGGVDGGSRAGPSHSRPSSDSDPGKEEQS